MLSTEKRKVVYKMDKTKGNLDLIFYKQYKTPILKTEHTFDECMKLEDVGFITKDMLERIKYKYENNIDKDENIEIKFIDNKKYSKVKRYAVIGEDREVIKVYLNMVQFINACEEYLK